MATLFKEYLGLRLTDGLYEEANKSYYISYNPDWALKSNIAYILHQADMMATHIEYDQWKYSEVVQDEETKQRVNNIVKAVVKKEEIQKLALTLSSVKNRLRGEKPKKVIIVPERIVNIVV